VQLHKKADGIAQQSGRRSVYKRKTHGVRHFAFPNKEALSAGILTVAIFFNAALAIVNAHFAVLSELHVSLFEAAISGLAVAVIALNLRVSMLPWAILFALCLLLHFALALANQAFNPKFIRDAINIPVFIALGMVYARGNIVRLFFFIQCVVFLVLLVELLFSNVYSSIFDVISYYVNTRNFPLQSFWDQSSTLFISATRPGDRFLLSFLGIHRASSIFLEPVSLGNYSIVAAVFTLTFWREMSGAMRFFFTVTTLIILVGSDGRLAGITCIVLVLGYFIFPLLPRYSNVLYLPGMLLLSGIMVTWFGFKSSGDDFAGRLALSIDFLTNLDIATLLGLHPKESEFGADSGISYFIITQSVFGPAAVWLFVCLVPRYHDRRSTIFVHSICIYIAFNLLVSYSMFSIKTAALMWFMYGYLLPGFDWRRANLGKYLGVRPQRPPSLTGVVSG
jgi:putative polymerase